MSVTHPFRFTLQAKGPADARGWREYARRAEDLGYHALTCADHFDDPLAGLPALVAAADATTSLRLGTLVLANDYRHPVVVAKETATIDLLTEGRLDIGLGAGWQRSDYDAAGLSLDAPLTRIERLAESIAVLKRLWSDEPCTFEGAHYRIRDLDGRPKPVQRPHPPLVLGGGGRRMLEFAAREGDVVAINVNLAAGVIDERAFPDGTASATDRKLGWIRAAAGGRFDDLVLQVRVHLGVVTEQRDSTIDELAPAFGLRAEEARETPHALIGSVDQLCDDLVERRDRWGISQIGLSGALIDDFAPVVARLAGT